MNRTIGIYYELPDGKIAYTFGWNGLEKIIQYCFDDDYGQRIVSQDEFNTWKPRRDLRDFPNSSDPRLPYVFDLFWDIKFKSQLKWALENHSDSDGIREKMREHNISL